MKIIRILLGTSFLFFILAAGRAQTPTTLAAGDFEKGIVNNDSVQVLDVRTAEEYNTGHIKNALLADWKDQKEFSRRIDFIDKQKPVYVYCLAGYRSAAAAEKMRAMGYNTVYELKGGIIAWKAENKSVEEKFHQKQMSSDELNSAISASKIVLVDFGAAWCPPCKKMEPVLKSLQQNNPGKFTLVKVDGGRDEDLLKKYSVSNLPVFILFKDGKQVWRKDGVAEEAEFVKFIK